MVSFSARSGPSSFRSSQRLTITVAHATLDALVERSNREGRSLSNLAAYLLESSLDRRGDGSAFAAPQPAAR
ncbi:hypothetical protein [Vulcanococcus sp.]|jgi:hypothetical protein|uniref:ribbon-helix-helix domain-containing protein n=1 Tax=Vulcanococcus sp. TaxID=2856995 RepID=UPI0037DA3D1D